MAIFSFFRRPVHQKFDYKLDIWAGVLPLKTIALPPEADPKMKEGLATPGSVLNYKI